TKGCTDTAIIVVKLYRCVRHICKNLRKELTLKQIGDTRSNNRGIHPIFPENIKSVAKCKGYSFLRRTKYMCTIMMVKVEIQKVRAYNPVVKNTFSTVSEWQDA